jgi:hypothetical protein
MATALKVVTTFQRANTGNLKFYTSNCSKSAVLLVGKTERRTINVRSGNNPHRNYSFLLVQIRRLVYPRNKQNFNKHMSPLLLTWDFCYRVAYNQFIFQCETVAAINIVFGSHVLISLKSNLWGSLRQAVVYFYYLSFVTSGDKFNTMEVAKVRHTSSNIGMCVQ